MISEKSHTQPYSLPSPQFPYSPSSNCIYVPLNYSRLLKGAYKQIQFFFFPSRDPIKTTKRII